MNWTVGVGREVSRTMSHGVVQTVSRDLDRTVYRARESRCSSSGLHLDISSKSEIRF